MKEPYISFSLQRSDTSGDWFTASHLALAARNYNSLSSELPAPVNHREARET